MKRTLLLAAVLAAAAAGCTKKTDSPAPEAPAPAPSPAEAPAPAPAPAPAATDPAAAPTGLLERGAPAPDISGKAHSGETLSLAAMRGKPVVVYFYPKDDTPGCTVEAQGIRDAWKEFTAAGVTVIGVSTDTLESHTAFAEKHHLPFALLPDPDGAIARAFGVPVNAGYAKRVTFLIGRDGKIAAVFPDVDPEKHAQEILEAVKTLPAG